VAQGVITTSQGAIMKERLKKDLKAGRYNFGHLAEDANVNRSYLSQILNGSVTPSIKVATLLAMAANRLTESTTYTPDMFIIIAQELDK